MNCDNNGRRRRNTIMVRVTPIHVHTCDCMYVSVHLIRVAPRYVSLTSGWGSQMDCANIIILTLIINFGAV